MSRVAFCTSFILQSFALFSLFLSLSLSPNIFQKSLSPFADHLALPSDALGGGGASPAHAATNELEMSPLIPKDSVITLDYVSFSSVQKKRDSLERIWSIILLNGQFCRGPTPSRPPATARYRRSSPRRRC